MNNVKDLKKNKKEKMKMSTINHNTLPPQISSMIENMNKGGPDNNFYLTLKIIRDTLNVVIEKFETRNVFSKRGRR